LKNKIGYLSFGRDSFSYGLALVLSRIDKTKYDLFRVTPKTAKYVDYLVFSCFWWEHIYCLADFLRKAGINKADKTRPVIIVGGFNTFNPVPFGAYADYIICGDGEEALPALLEGDTTQSCIHHEGGLQVKWFNVKKLQGFAHVTNDVTRVEISRGCKFRCKFCAVSHLKPYREISYQEIEPLVKSCRTKKIALFSPEPTMHHDNDKITALCSLNGKTRLDTDVRLDRIGKRHDEGGLLRCGIEGLSERLRKSVGKAYSNDYIFQVVEKAIKTNRPGIMFYLIMDLPGESNEDFEEFRDLLHRFETIQGAEDFLLIPSPSVFMPSPHTPLEFEGINWKRDYRNIWLNLFRSHDKKGDRPWKFKLAERTRIFGPSSRILSMLSTRSGKEFYAIEKDLTAKKLIKVGSNGRLIAKDPAYIVRALKEYGGVDKYCGPYTSKSAPWKLLKV